MVVTDVWMVTCSGATIKWIVSRHWRDYFRRSWFLYHRRQIGHKLHRISKAVKNGYVMDYKAMLRLTILLFLFTGLKASVQGLQRVQYFYWQINRKPQFDNLFRLKRHLIVFHASIGTFFSWQQSRATSKVDVHFLVVYNLYLRFHQETLWN